MSEIKTAQEQGVKMSKFDKYFKEPSYFSDGSYVLSGNLTKDAAALQLSLYMGEHISPDSLELDRVRYGFAPPETEGMAGESCWYTGARGKGSRPVWVYG
jgi:hypothetical protein